ncbi:MAG: methyltransferase domain-containing protein [Anaerolineales bacterium]|nr:methyltransferase domain-containing protein [Anaerolineales bacterium]
MLALFCHPQSHAPLALELGDLVTSNGERFPVEDGIPRLLPPQIPFRHRFWAWVYNQTAFAYDWGVAFAWGLKLGGQPIERRTYLEKIKLKPDALVLETAVGTGLNIQQLPAHARYVGLDISFAMLQRCQKNLAGWGREATLVQGDAQWLPFREGVFDAVYHMGGLQFLAEPQRALAEALRVTKPGGHIWMVDEAYSVPRLVRHARGMIPPRGTAPAQTGVEALSALVPPSADDIHAELISNGELYFLSFRKRF